MTTISVTLANGATYSKSYVKLPRHWKSVAMHLAPYDSDFRGATFIRERTTQP